MTRTTLRAVGATTLALGLLVSGCGGSDPLTAKEFRTKANALCKKAGTDTETYGKGLTESSSDADIIAAIGKLAKRNLKLADDIDDLEPPKSMADDVTAMLKALRAALKKLDDATKAELENNTEEPFAAADELADKLKLDECSH